MADASPGPPDPLSGLIGYQLRRAASAQMAKLARALEPVGLSATEASVLLMVASRPRITQSELGRLLGIQRANMTPLVAGLAERGLVEREAMDGRSLGLTLSAAGAEARARADAAIREHERGLAGGIGAAERELLARTLRGWWS